MHSLVVKPREVERSRADDFPARRSPLHSRSAPEPNARVAPPASVNASSSLDLGPHIQHARHVLTGEVGTLLPILHDAHVHTHLFDVDALGRAGIGAVLDLGGDPARLSRTAERNGVPHIAYAGAFLTAPGGYPSGRDWAPKETIREVRPPTDRRMSPAEGAVSEQVAFGASVIKVCLNVQAGPVFDAAALAAIVASARMAGLPVVAHAQGRGMVELAVDAGVDALACTPWTERLADPLLARAASGGQRWISAIDTHGHSSPNADRERAIDNLRRFVAAGGRVLYGTGLGKGHVPVGVNGAEISALLDAGLTAADVIDALTSSWPVRHETGLATFVAGAPPTKREDLPSWLSGAHVVSSEDYAVTG